MIICNTCGASVPNNTKKCPECGTANPLVKGVSEPPNNKRRPESSKPLKGEKKMEYKGVEQQARPLPLIILADTSTSMRGEKISMLNQALAALIQDLRADEQTRESVWVSLITFDSKVEEVITLEPVQSVNIPKLDADGMTSLGQALRVALTQLADTERLPNRCLLPVIVLVTDGQPTDEWQSALEELKSHNRVRRALRLALAIGPDADLGMLQEVVSGEYPVLMANESEKIKTFFQFVTFRTKKMFQSVGRDRGGNDAPPDLLP